MIRPLLTDDGFLADGDLRAEVFLGPELQELGFDRAQVSGLRVEFAEQLPDGLDLPVVMDSL